MARRGKPQAQLPTRQVEILSALGRNETTHTMVTLVREPWSDGASLRMAERPETAPRPVPRPVSRVLLAGQPLTGAERVALFRRALLDLEGEA